MLYLAFLAMVLNVCLQKGRFRNSEIHPSCGRLPPCVQILEQECLSSLWALSPRSTYQILDPGPSKITIQATADRSMLGGDKVLNSVPFRILNSVELNFFKGTKDNRFSLIPCFGSDKRRHNGIKEAN
jgi:hypothetical protein